MIRTLPILSLIITLPGCSQPQLIAIDVLIQPDQVMLEQAGAWNQRMRDQIPEGFELDETHLPHITLIQRHVLEADLDAVLAAVDAVRNAFDVESLRMTANGLYHIPTGENGLAGITVEPTEELHELQRAVIAAVNPFSQSGGDESAYVPDPTDTPFDPILFEYVDTFVPQQTGEQFNPHVTIGLAPAEWLERIEEQPFERFEFGAEGLAVYQLGNFGTASKRLD